MQAGMLVIVGLFALMRKKWGSLLQAILLLATHFQSNLFCTPSSPGQFLAHLKTANGPYFRQRQFSKLHDSSRQGIYLPTQDNFMKSKLLYKR